MAAPLRNKKHEAVAVSYLADPDKSGTAAYKSVYPESNDHSAATGFARLWKRAEFQARIAEVQNEAMGTALVNETMVIDELRKIGTANALDYVTIGKDGQPFIDWSKVTRDQGAAISSVQVTEKFERRPNPEMAGEFENVPVRTVKFTLTPKTAALDLLGKYLKLWIEKHEHKHTGSFTLADLVNASLKPKGNGAVPTNGAHPPEPAPAIPTAH